MNKVVKLTTIIAFSIMSISQAQNYSWNNNPGSLPSGIKHATYKSTAMNVDIGYNIFLPSDYNSSNERYPVIYALHGMGGNENEGPEPYSKVLQSGINSKAFPPVIVVFVNGRGNTFYSDSKDGSVKCETTISKELIAHIDATYRTKADRTQRAIEGFSMGGFGALLHGFKHTEQYTSISTYDAALVTWDTISQQQFDQSIPRQIFGSDKQYFTDNCYPFTFAKKNVETIKSLGIKVKMVTGSNDLQMGPLYYYNLAMRDTLTKLGMAPEFKIIQGGSHGSGRNETTIRESIIFHTNNFKTTGVINRQPLSYASMSVYKPRIVSSMSTFTVPSAWKGTVSAISVSDLKGRNIGLVEINDINSFRIPSSVSNEKLLISPVR
ncbi:MAG: esterase family protein [Fibrobacter sp.]|nr:esterase family protein [Fibrobacter sp.]